MVKKQFFASYLLQIKRFRRSGKLIENESPNGIKKILQLKPLASKVWFFEISMDFGQLIFFMFFGVVKKLAPKMKKTDFGVHKSKNQ